MQIQVILVEPQYEENIGLVARAMKNFGLKQLCLVRPVADHQSDKAVSRAMHAQNILKQAKVVKSLAEALEKAEVSVATTAKLSGRQKLSRSALTARQLAEKYQGSKGKIALVFGREPNGLTNEEIEECDVLLNIPCSPSYGTMNLAQSAAVVFYELFQFKGTPIKKLAGKNIRERLLEEFRTIVFASGSIKDKKKTVSAFKSFLGKSPLTEKEARAVLSGLKAGKKL